MSRYAEIQDQYRGYVAAREAVKKTNPGEVKVAYKHEEANNRFYDEYFVYNPEDDTVNIETENGTRHLCIKAADIPGLVKALRDFFE